MPRLTADELAHRKNGMGSTDVVEACGLAPWVGAGPMRLFCTKLGIASPDAEEDLDEDKEDQFEWGHRLEPVILQWYTDKHSASAVPGGHVPHPEIPWLWASLDATVLGASRIVEIKSVSSPALYSHWDESSQDGIPRYVRAQVTIAMSCHGAREAHVVASVGGRPPHVWEVAYDEELASLLIEGAGRFWQLVKDGTPPPMDHTSASKEYLRHRFPSNGDRVIEEATDRENALGLTRISAAMREGLAKKEKNKIDAELMALVGDRAGIKGTGWCFTWKTGDDGKRRQRFTARGVE